MRQVIDRDFNVSTSNQFDKAKWFDVTKQNSGL